VHRLGQRQQAALALQDDVGVGLQVQPDLVLPADPTQRADGVPAHAACGIALGARGQLRRIGADLE